MESRSKFTICRLCLYKSECLIDIFEVNVRYGYVAAEVITDLLQFQVLSSDIYPRVVCSRCLDKLTEFKVFKEQCKASRATYDNLFVPTESYPDVQYIPNPMGLRTVKIEPIEITDDDMSSQMSCRSENIEADEIITNEVSTTQEDLVPIPMKSVEETPRKEMQSQAGFGTVNVDYASSKVPIQTNFSSSSMEQKFAVKEVSTQVSFNPENSDEKYDVSSQSKKKRDETPDQRDKRLQRQRNYYNQRKQTESPEKREVRLSKMRELATRRRENESQEQREERLSQLRMYAVKRIANESNDQREQRLRNMRIYAENRLANESLEQRQKRLGHAPFNAQEKKPPERKERKPYARQSRSSTGEDRGVDPISQHELFGEMRLSLPPDRLYEPQGQFHEYLSQLGLGLVEQRVNQMHEQYGGSSYAQPRPVLPEHTVSSNQEKYQGHFNQIRPEQILNPGPDKYIGHFNQLRPGLPQPGQNLGQLGHFGQVRPSPTEQDKFGGLMGHLHGGASDRRPGETHEQHQERLRQMGLYVPERGGNEQHAQQPGQQQQQQPPQKKMTEIKMYEIL